MVRLLKKRLPINSVETYAFCACSAASCTCACGCGCACGPNPAALVLLFGDLSQPASTDISYGQAQGVSAAQYNWP